ncbi:MAG: hypothetical protein ACREAQ_00180 [Nitrososphaera sp.]
MIGSQRIEGTVVRLGTRHLDAQLDRALPALTNVRRRRSYPGLGYDSGDLYGKVVDARDGYDAGLTRICLTSVDSTDQGILEMFLED